MEESSDIFIYNMIYLCYIYIILESLWNWPFLWIPEKYQILVKNSGTFLPGGYSKSGLPLIKKEDYEILYGLILGDAYISRKNTENASLRFEQSIIHKEYLKHLFDN